MTRIIYHFRFTWPVEVSGLHLGDLDLDGAAMIVRDREDRDWQVEEWFVRGGNDGEIDINPTFGFGAVVSLREAAARELQRTEHRAAIEDMFRQMSGQDAAA